MINIVPNNQTELFCMNSYINELIELDNKNKLPNKILLSGQKGIGKSTLAYHFINYTLSKGEDFSYDFKNLKILSENHTHKTILNKSNPNLFVVEVNEEKKFIDIKQIRDLILQLNKSSFNQKPRFVLIDNIELLNTNSINALLKTLEEPTYNTHFILINNNKKILSTLLSRCINFKVSLTHEECLFVTNNLFDGKLHEYINKDLLNHYLTPGNIFQLIKFSDDIKYDLVNSSLKNFLKNVINNNYYKKDKEVKYLIYNFIEFYFRKINSSFSSLIYKKYVYFLKRISETQKFNLDEDSLFIEFEREILNG
jgi:DNA polymerase III subunit delta'